MLTVKQLLAALADADPEAVVVVDTGKSFCEPALFVERYRGRKVENRGNAAYRLGGGEEPLIILKI